MNCKCKEWKENIPKLNASFAFSISHPHLIQSYEGKKFKYCPWCGSKLIGNE